MRQLPNIENSNFKIPLSLSKAELTFSIISPQPQDTHY